MKLVNDYLTFTRNMAANMAACVPYALTTDILIFTRLLTSNQNNRSVWSRRLASRSSPTNMAASRPPV